MARAPTATFSTRLILGLGALCPFGEPRPVP